jgi:phosphoglucosamine mutase
MSIRFGTDGVRGVANEQITAEVAIAIGRATARVFPSSRVVIGRDTRRSGPMLESAVAAGVCAEGADAVLLGVVPTPAVAVLCARDGVPGVVISASHNPFDDNGLKVFAPGGRKLSDDEQAAVEAAIAEVLDGAAPRATGAGVGVVVPDDAAAGAYADSVVATLEGRDLSGLSLVVDCANGANSQIAPSVLRSLGAEVTVLCASPDGTNINDDCGSTHPAALQRAVRELGADAGIAFDGDADRLIAVDHSGELVDGDAIIALCAVDLRDRRLLANDTVVVTVMSNLGLHRAMQAAGITVVQTSVGDRHVLEALAAGGHSLGGEQSGHIVFADRSTTGDGLLAALTLLDLLRRAGRPLAELAGAAMTRLPQVLVNVAVAEPMPDVAERIAESLDAARAGLGTDGRVLVRPSGTEPVVRVMVEATESGTARHWVDTLAAAVEAAAATGPTRC